MATKTQTTSSSTIHVTGKKKWNTVYPLYINSKKSISEGRRIPKADGVENPTAVGLFEAVKTLGLTCEFEPYKTHPRDFGVNGRIKVKLFNDDDTPVLADIPTKDDLLLKIAKAVPQAGSSGDQSKKGKKGKK